MGLSTDPLVVAGRPWLVVDVETCPLPACAEYLTDPIEAPSNYKDPQKIAAYVYEKRLKQIAEAALDLDLCEIVAIGIGFADATYAQTRATTSEEAMLRGLWSFVQTVRREHGQIVGFNCLSFDLPILLRRSLYLNVPTPELQVDRYRHDGIVDVADVLTFSGRMTWRSLSFYAKRFGVPYDDTVKGEQIPQLVTDGQWDVIESHVRWDVETTRALALRIGIIQAHGVELG